jgi:ornithine carbamoyltransferase
MMVKWNPELHGRSLLRMADLTDTELLNLIDLAVALKARRRAGVRGELLKRRQVALIFEKSSTRTRNSASVAIRDEGGSAEYLSKGDIHLGAKESVKDTARVLGRLFDGILFRGFHQKTVETLARYSGVPVWNGLTDDFHPTQILADLMTIEEHLDKPLKDVKVVLCGDTRNNMSYAWMYGCAKMGMRFVAYGPQELAPDAAILEKVNTVAAETGADIRFSSDAASIAGADVIYTDVWASMGEEAQIPERVRLLTPYKVTMELIKATGNPKVLFLHCLPAFHDFETVMAKSQMEAGYDIREVTDEVFRSEHAVVFDEAENRMHTIKAVMVATLA